MIHRCTFDFRAATGKTFLFLAYASVCKFTLHDYANHRRNCNKYLSYLAVCIKHVCFIVVEKDKPTDRAITVC